MCVNHSLFYQQVIQNTSGADVVEEGVVVLSAKQGTWEHDGVEWNVVLGHELVELDLLGILPPSLPVCACHCKNYNAALTKHCYCSCNHKDHGQQ